MGLPKVAAKDSDRIEPWGYAQVKAFLDDWKRTYGDSPPSPK